MQIDYKKSFIKNNIYIIFCNILIYGRSIILLPLLIKSLGIIIYGGYVLLTTGIGFVSAISTLGIGFKFQRFMPSTKDASEARQLFYPQFILQVANAVVASLILIISSNFIKITVFKNQVDFSMFLVASILIMYAIYSVTTDFLRFTNKLHYFAVFTTSHAYLVVLFIIITMFVFHERTLNSLLIAYLSALVLSVLPLIGIISKEIGFALPSFNVKDIMEDIRLGFPLVLSYVVDFILSSSDKYVIAIIISTVAVGYYSPAYTLGSLIILVPKVFAVVLSPLLSKAADSNNDNETAVLMNYTVKLFIIIAVPFIAGSFILSKVLLVMLANKEVADMAYLVTPIIAIGTLFYGLNLIYAQILFVKLRTKLIFGINALSACLNLVLNLVFIFIFKNIIVAAITTLVSYFISFIILNIKIKEFIKIDYNFTMILKCVISSIVMVIFLHAAISIFAITCLNMGLIVFLSLVLYILLCLFLGAFSKKETKFVQNFCLSLFNAPQS